MEEGATASPAHSNQDSDNDDFTIDFISESDAYQSSISVNEATNKSKVQDEECFTTIRIWDSIGRCSAHSSFHRVPFLTAHRQFNMKLKLWIVFVLVALVLMLLSLGAISSTFVTGGTYLASSYHFPKQMKFPAITLCNFNRFRASAVLTNNMSLEQADLLLAYLSNTVGIRSLPVSFFTSFAQQYDAARGGNNTPFQDMGHTIEAMLLSCTFDGRPCSAQDFTTRPTSVGLCHTFNPNGNFTPYRVSRPGYRYGLLLKLNVEQYEYFTSTANSAGVNVFIHDHDHFPYIGTHNRLLISPGVRTQMIITEKRYRLLSPPDGQCNDHVTLTYFKSYTRESCLIECETQLTIRECGCKAEYMPGSTRTCTLNETIYCLVPYKRQFQQKYCNCPVPCESVEYNIKQSYAKYPSPHMIDVYNNSYFLQSGVFPIPDNAISTHTYPNGTVLYYLPSWISRQGLADNQIKFIIYYDALEYIQIREEIQYTTFRFIADCTGLTSILIGTGFLSFFEILELIYSFFKPSDSTSIRINKYQSFM